MPLKNQALTVTYIAWDTSANGPKTGDVANHTLRGVGDGSEFTPANSPAEVDSTNLKGVYKLALTAGEMNYNCVTLGGVSSTSNIVLYPVQIFTDRGVLPNAAAGASNGLLISGSNSGTTTLAALTVTGALTVSGGATLTNASGDGLTCSSTGGNGNGLTIAGNGSGKGASITAGATGNAVAIVGGSSSGKGIAITTTSGDGLSILPTAGHGIVATANGTSKHGVVVTGGTGGTSDGLKLVAGTGGVDLRAQLAANAVDNIVIETGVNLRQSLSPILAAASGQLSGATTSTITIKAGNDNTTTRIVATVDGSGNRTGVTLTLPT